MTNERQHPDSAAETDETVSATYRELSREGAPNHLNDKVLQQAARHALRPRYSRSIVWTRPLAWAATVGLCLAIVLEVTRVPAPETVMIEDTIDFLEAESLTAPEAVQAPVRQQPETLKDFKSQLGRSTAKQAAKESKSEVRRRETAYDAEVDFNSVEESVVSDKVEFEMQDADECSVEVRADPVKWLACIADLEESGDVEATLRQREALREAFPQFEMP
jgi:hypothetical protein